MAQLQHKQHKSDFRCSTAKLRPLTLALLAMCSSSVALAQTVLAPVEVTAPPEPGLGLNLPLTAGSRTGVSAQALPASVEQIDAETMRRRGDFGLVEAITRSTGLTSQGTGGNGGLAFSARGFAGVNSVGVAEDGSRIGTAAGTINYPNTSWGYERIEVLRGPASIVSGAGTAGAVINAVRKQPSREQSSEVLFGVGQYDSYRLGLGATGPLGEIASYRVDVYGHQQDAKRDHSRGQGGKLMSTLRLQPSSDVRVELLADFSEQRPGDYWGTPTHEGKVVKSLRHENYNASNGLIHYKDNRVRARAEWAVNSRVTLRNELFHFTSDRHWKNIEAYRYQPATATVQRSDYLEIRHELAQLGNRLEAAIEHGDHKAVFGWEFARANLRLHNNSPYGGSSTVSARDPVHGKWDSPDLTLRKVDTDTTQHAFYFEDAWRFSPQSQLLLGARHDQSDYDRRDWLTGVKFGKKLNGTAWRLGLSHFISEQLSVYGQYSKGYDPIDSMLSMSMTNTAFKLTSAKQYELGIKQQFGQGLGEWTAAIYRIDKDDIITRDPLQPALSVQGGSQHSKGIELSGVLRPSRVLTLEANYALVDAEFDKLIEAGGADRSGKRPSNVARHNANLWGHYLIGDWQASLGARHVGKRYANNANSLTLPSYTVFDAALSWQYDARTTLRLLGRNLSDKLHATASYGGNFILGEERRVELIAEMKF